MLTYSLLFKIGAKSGPSRIGRGRPVPGNRAGDYWRARDERLLRTGAVRTFPHPASSVRINDLNRVSKAADQQRCHS